MRPFFNLRDRVVTVKETRQFLLVIFGVILFCAWLGGHYGFWPINNNVQRTSSSDYGLVQGVANTKNPRLCRGLINPIDRYSCSNEVVFRLADGLSVEDCMANDSLLMRGYCTAEAAPDEYYENPNDCNYITEDYYRRLCHFLMQPEELIRLGGLVSWFELALSLFLFLVMLYFLCDWYVGWRGRYPKKFSATIFALLGWASMYAFSILNPFGILAYHSTVIQRMGCPPNADVCVDGGWISFPTPWGVFVMLLLMPLIYLICGKIVARLHRKHGSPVPIVASWLTFILSTRKRQWIGILLALLFLMYVGFAIYHFFAPIKPLGRAYKEVEQEFIVATSTWKTYQSPTGFTFGYPSDAEVLARGDGISINLMPTIGIAQNFKDEYGDLSSLPNLSFYVFEVPLLEDDPQDPVAYLKAHEKDEMYSMRYAQEHQKTNTLSKSEWCRPGVLDGLATCYVHDDIYGYETLSQYMTSHHYFVKNGYFVHTRALGPLADLSKASMLERRNYKLLLNYVKLVDEIIKSFKFTDTKIQEA